MSHPVWVRGLKQAAISYTQEETASHPVWVRGLKLRCVDYALCREASHPVWVRGLKLEKELRKATDEASHPVWVRGLKRVGIRMVTGYRDVAPRVGAWIETQSVATLAASMICRTPCGCVD